MPRPTPPPVQAIGRHCLRLHPLPPWRMPQGGAQRTARGRRQRRLGPVSAGYRGVLAGAARSAAVPPNPAKPPPSCPPPPSRITVPAAWRWSAAESGGRKVDGSRHRHRLAVVAACHAALAWDGGDYAVHREEEDGEWLRRHPRGTPARHQDHLQHPRPEPPVRSQTQPPPCRRRGLPWAPRPPPSQRQQVTLRRWWRRRRQRTGGWWPGSGIKCPQAAAPPIKSTASLCAAPERQHVALPAPFQE